MRGTYCQKKKRKYLQQKVSFTESFFLINVGGIDMDKYLNILNMEKHEIT